jgi:predicted transcriptional regulator
MNKQAFRAMLAAHGDVYADVAKLLHSTTPTVSDKVNGKNGAGFNQSEMAKLKEHYHLSAEQIDLIFFGDTVS